MLILPEANEYHSRNAFRPAYATREPQDAVIISKQQ